jgi:apolipoprotein N-acyltransferase
MNSTSQGKRKEIFLIFASVLTGVLSAELCGRWPNLLSLWGLMPFFWLEAESRRTAFLVPFVFYLAISRGIVPGAYVFFRDGSLIRALVLWIASAAALAVPWGLLWSGKSPTKKALGVIFAVLASILPPLGLIGWGNPLTAAGLFFPGFGWLGLALALDLYAEAAQSMKLRRTLTILVIIAAPLLSLPVFDERTAIGGVAIMGANTSFGRLASGSGDFNTQYERERAVFRYIRKKERNGELEGAEVIVLPETVIGRANSTTLKRWKKFFEPFVQQGITFIAGGEIPADRGRKYDTVMISFEPGGKNQTALQRFPVPFSMFRPFSDEGANAYLSSLGEVSVMEIQGKRLGFLVCYEQFLTWPILSLMSQKPNAVVAPSNLWWCGETPLPEIQAGAVRLWARLFGIPTVKAANR